MLWPVFNKPWNTADMEFHYGLWNGVSALYSESERQLGEENTRPFTLNHHLAAETIQCKYSGSRYGRSINMSALRTAMQNFDSALEVTGLVKSYHSKRIDKEIGIWDLYIIARASIAIIAYQKRYKKQQEKQNKVSDILASQYQFISGVFMICRHMMENGDKAIIENAPISAEKLYKYADENGIFVSFNGMACAGSTKKIMDFLYFVQDNDHAACDEIGLNKIVTNPDNWYRYAMATIEFDCFIELERAQQCKKINNNNNQLDYDTIITIYRGLQNYCLRLSPALSNMNLDTNFLEESLERQNHILALLGRSPISKIADKHVANRLGNYSLQAFAN